MKTAVIALALLVAALAGAAPAQAADATLNWTQHCAACHGKDGKGDTKAGKKAKVKDLTDPNYQGTFTDDGIFKAIKEGMKHDGKEVMKPYADKLSDDEIKALVELVRKFKK